MAQPLDPRAVGDLADGGRLGEEAPAVGLAGVGRRQLDLRLEPLERLGDGERDEPARRDGAPRGGEEAAALGQQLDRLHRHGDEREDPVAGVEAGGVGDERAHRQAVGALGQRGQQVGVDVERRDLVAGAGEVERHAPGAGADVEHRAAGLVRQLAPQRQVGDVGAALDVVPDHLGVHRQYSSCPRRLSTSLSSSSAV